MRRLPDTHVPLRALDGNPRLGAVARDRIEDGGNDVMVSAASIWEIAIKKALHRDGFGVSPRRIAEAARATDLPLPAQAAIAGLPVLTADALLPPCGVMVMQPPA